MAEQDGLGVAGGPEDAAAVLEHDRAPPPGHPRQERIPGQRHLDPSERGRPRSRRRGEDQVGGVGLAVREVQAERDLGAWRGRDHGRVELEEALEGVEARDAVVGRRGGSEDVGRADQQLGRAVAVLVADRCHGLAEVLVLHLAVDAGELPSVGPRVEVGRAGLDAARARSGRADQEVRHAVAVEVAGPGDGAAEGPAHPDAAQIQERGPRRPGQQVGGPGAGPAARRWRAGGADHQLRHPVSVHVAGVDDRRPEPEVGVRPTPLPEGLTGGSGVEGDRAGLRAAARGVLGADHEVGHRVAVDVACSGDRPAEPIAVEVALEAAEPGAAGPRTEEGGAVVGEAGVVAEVGADQQVGHRVAVDVADLCQASAEGLVPGRAVEAPDQRAGCAGVEPHHADVGQTREVGARGAAGQVGHAVAVEVAGVGDRHAEVIASGLAPVDPDQVSGPARPQLDRADRRLAAAGCAEGVVGCAVTVEVTDEAGGDADPLVDDLAAVLGGDFPSAADLLSGRGAGERQGGQEERTDSNAVAEIRHGRAQGGEGTQARPARGPAARPSYSWTRFRAALGADGFKAVVLGPRASARASLPDAAPPSLGWSRAAGAASGRRAAPPATPGCGAGRPAPPCRR